MTNNNMVVVLSDSKKDPSFTSIEGTCVMRLTELALKHYNSISTCEDNGDVVKVYDLKRIMEVLEENNLLGACEVAGRSAK